MISVDSPLPPSGLETEEKLCLARHVVQFCVDYWDQRVLVLQQPSHQSTGIQISLSLSERVLRSNPNFVVFQTPSAGATGAGCVLSDLTTSDSLVLVYSLG